MKIAFIYDGNLDGVVETRAFVNCNTQAKIDEALRTAVKNPSVKFLIRTYCWRIYEAKFLLGMLAGIK